MHQGEVHHGGVLRLPLLPPRGHGQGRGALHPAGALLLAQGIQGEVELFFLNILYIFPAGLRAARDPSVWG